MTFSCKARPALMVAVVLVGTSGLIMTSSFGQDDRIFDSRAVRVESDPAVCVDQYRAYISQAIDIGSAAYNYGDRRGCYEIYACTARLIVRTIPDAPYANWRLRAALARSAVSSDSGTQAFILRKAFDELLGGAPAAMPGRSIE